MSMEVAHHYYKCTLSFNLKALIVIEEIQFRWKICHYFYVLSQNKGRLTPQIQITGLPALSLSTPLVIVNNYSEFQVDTLDSL